jgi:hypothetical protein
LYALQPLSEKVAGSQSLLGLWSSSFGERFCVLVVVSSSQLLV